MSFRRVAQALDNVKPAHSLKELFDAHYSIPPVNSLRQIQSRHNNRNKKKQRFWVFNTELMDVPLRGRKPAVEYRDAEIGAFAEENFDLVALNEVWHEEERDDLVEKWPRGIHVTHKSGVQRSKGKRIVRGIFSVGASEIGETNLAQMLRSAGLVSLSRQLEDIAHHFHEYEAEPYLEILEPDPEKLSAKGCLLTVYDTGFGAPGVPSSLLVYNTHLAAGSDSDNIGARYNQLLELFHFIWRTKDKPQGDFNRPGRPGLNGCILAGDFNINSIWHSYDTINLERTLGTYLNTLPEHLRNAVIRRYDANGNVVGNEIALYKSGYELLRDLAHASGFRDLWAYRNDSRGYTVNVSNSDIRNVIANQDPLYPLYCNDEIDERAIDHLLELPKTIDYIFVSATTSAMDFTMDFTRPRRTYTPRPPNAPDRAKMPWMSDHLGIATDVLLSPK